MNSPHSFSNCDKIAMCDKVDEGEEMNITTGSPRTETLMTNEQGYGTNPDLYEN